MGQPKTTILCIINLGTVSVVESQRVIRPGLGPACVVYTVRQPAGLLVNKLTLVWQIQQFDGALNHFVAQLQVFGSATDFQQREHGLSKAVHVNRVQAVVVVTGRTVFGEESLHVVGITLANAVIELAVCRGLA